MSYYALIWFGDDYRLICIKKESAGIYLTDSDFLFYDNNAVLNTGSEIYGVVVDDKLHELHSQVAPIQKDSFDMVQVYINGLISKNPKTEGWPEIIKIKDIDSVAPSTTFENQMIEIRTE